MGGDQPIDLTELGGNINHHTDYSGWRLGRPSRKLGNRLFMRIATRTDEPKPEKGKEFGRKPFGRDNRRILRNAGGLLSSSRKRKIQEQMAADQSAAVEQEVTTKRYSGGLGKNPWGAVAQDWHRTSQRDFADELGELASALQGKGSRSAGRERVTVSSSRIGRSRQVTAPLTDWDAPELNEAALIKPIDVDADPSAAPADDEPSHVTTAAADDANNDADSESEEGEMDDQWKQRLKKPHMTMRADEEEMKTTKKSAFARVGFSPGSHKGGSVAKKRKSSDDGPITGGLRSEVAVPKKRMSSDGLKSVRDTLASKKDLRAKIPGRGLSDKLKSRLGNVGNVHSAGRRRSERDYSDDEEREFVPTKRSFEFHERRINRRNSESFEDSDAGEEDMRDPLEKEDILSREFRESGGQLPNMVIQVTRSPEPEEGREDNNQDIEDRQVDKDTTEDMDMEQEQKPTQVVQSMVKKIKTEKGEEERKAAKAAGAARRDKERAEREERRKEERREKEAERQRREREEKKEKERQLQQLKERQEKEESERQAARQARREKESRQRAVEKHTQRAAELERLRRAEERRDRPATAPVRIKKEKTSDDERREKRKKRQQGRKGDSSDSDSSSGSSSDSDSDSDSSSSSDSSDSSSSSSSGSSSDSDSSSSDDSRRGGGRKRDAKKIPSQKKKSGEKEGDKRRRGEPDPKRDKKSSTSGSSSKRPSSSGGKASSSSTNRKPSSSSASKSKSSDAKRGKSGSSGGGSKDLNDKLQDYLKKAKERQKKDGGSSKKK